MPEESKRSLTYKSDFYDELIDEDGNPYGWAKLVLERFSQCQPEQLDELNRTTLAAIKRLGISFTVYSEGENIDRDWPFDLIPRVIPRSQWNQVRDGLIQRTRALNAFIQDVYNERRIFADKVIPKDIVLESPNYLPICQGTTPKHRVWANICGSDLVRDSDRMYVLEDNLRIPSGIAYMLENRALMKRVVPELFDTFSVAPVDEYPSQLYAMLAALTPRPKFKPNIVILTPGIYNSAYFEHAFLAQKMGVELVEGSDLFIRNKNVYMKTITGPQRVDVIYRRIDEQFLDPEAFNPDSVVGVPGLIESWKAGRVSIANAPGSGVADDKVVYAYVPEMIRYYLQEEPLMASVDTYLCANTDDRQYVLDNIGKLVVKPANESGGYGLMVGPHADEKMHRQFAEHIKADPRKYIAQPTLKLSTVPTICDQQIQPRHVDLRPFILSGKNVWVTPGGLTRVALVEGSLVVNSSQGGGSKDTWIFEDAE